MGEPWVAQRGQVSGQAVSAAGLERGTGFRRWEHGGGKVIHAHRAAGEFEWQALGSGLEHRRYSQASLAARAGMRAPDVSRIESSLSQNLTLRTLVRLARAMNSEPHITFKPRRTVAASKR